MSKRKIKSTDDLNLDDLKMIAFRQRSRIAVLESQVAELKEALGHAVHGCGIYKAPCPNCAAARELLKEEGKDDG